MERQEYEGFKVMDISKLTIHQCIEMDSLVKAETLSRAEVILKEKYPTMDDITMGYMNQMLKFHYGSVETDEMLKHLGAYPEWV
jgi:hypothetical protein